MAATKKPLAEIEALVAENLMLREEIRVSREAAEITAHLVVEQFEKTEGILARLQQAHAHLNDNNRELEEANQRLQQLDKLKSDFLSSVSHELRTPLTSIRGFASLIEREFSRSFAPLAGEDAKLRKKSDRIGDNLGIILKESERLTRLINDVLDLAKIESGRVEWRDTLLSIDKLVGDAINAVQGMFDVKPDVALRHEIQNPLPLVLGDADRLQQVLVNLLNNAAKFTERGEVQVKAFLNDRHLIQMEIRDTGSGFPPEDAEKIFDKFQQSGQGDTLTDKPKGTGLGLAIAREIIEHHGGKIWASSVLGQGSVFTFTLPPTAEGGEQATVAATPDNTAVPPAPTFTIPSRGKHRVLVVDDDPAICDYLSQLLQEQGCEVVTAPNGQAALVAAQKHHPDLITMDLAMPVMDGRTAITRLRADPELQRIPIMVVSAMPDWETAGGDAALCKPIDEVRLVDSIHLLLGSTRTTDATEVRLLILYDGQASTDTVPNTFAAWHDVDFCRVDELASRIQSGFRGLLAVPADLIDKVDIDALHATPALTVTIIPVPASGVLLSRQE